MNECAHTMTWRRSGRNHIDRYDFDCYKCTKCGHVEIRNKRSLPRRDPEGGATD